MAIARVDKHFHRWVNRVDISATGGAVVAIIPMTCNVRYMRISGAVTTRAGDNITTEHPTGITIGKISSFLFFSFLGSGGRMFVSLLFGTSPEFPDRLG